jgi:hypothetical protein
MSASEQARADAMADAATLRLVSEDISEHCWNGSWDFNPCRTCLDAVQALRLGAEWSERDMWRFLVEATVEFYAQEASAAFRAVPGLRGAR